MTASHDVKAEVQIKYFRKCMLRNWSRIAEYDRSWFLALRGLQCRCHLYTMLISLRWRALNWQGFFLVLIAGACAFSIRNIVTLAGNWENCKLCSTAIYGLKIATILSFYLKIPNKDLIGFREQFFYLNFTSFWGIFSEYFGEKTHFYHWEWDLILPPYRPQKSLGIEL